MFCRGCGERLNSSACSRCGAPLAPGTLFCGTCGEQSGNVSSGTKILGPSNVRHNAGHGNITLIVLEGQNVLASIELDHLKKEEISIGSSDGNDIRINSASNTVSRNHAVLVKQDGAWVLKDSNSTNGLFMNGMRIDELRISAGDVITVGKRDRRRDSVTFLFGSGMMRWCMLDLSGRALVNVGRVPGNDLVIPVSTVSANHMQMYRDNTGDWWIKDSNSFNGTFADGHLAVEPHKLTSGTSIIVGNVPMVFMGDYLLYSTERMGVDVVARDLVKIRKNGAQTRVTTDHVSLHIRKGEFVAIVGGSGCGKSTLLNELNGSDKATEGTVVVNDIDFYENYNKMKNTIGHVPQDDIVYDNLKLIDMIRYAAELRMPSDTSREEREMRAQEVIQLLELQDVANNLISNLSGGQKKRASIAVELLADPRLLFLDEPTSGLDPGIERSLMHKLAEMAHEGRTIVLVTHTTLNLHLCDQVVFLAPGGKLAYAGPPEDAKDFFGVKDFVDVYSLIASDPEGWERKFRMRGPQDSGFASTASGSTGITEKEVPSFGEQLRTLVKRYLHLLINDRARLVLLLGQAPLLSALICLVADSGCFTIFESTQSCLFALSCAAFWVGILDSIQEICKERTIFIREYAGGMRISAYVASKVIVLGALCVIQAFSLVLVFCLLEGSPEKSLIWAPLELFVGTFLITFSAMCLGLMVSSLFKNADRAIATAPLLIMPQILFSGLVFELEGMTKFVSTFVNCRWGMTALGTSANLNDLDLSIYGEEITIPAQKQDIENQTITVPETTTKYMGQDITIDEHKETFDSLTVDVPETTKTIDADMLERTIDNLYDFTIPHLLSSWGVLALFSVVCIAGCYGILRYKFSKL